MTSLKLVLFAVLGVAALVEQATGHGRLLEPPSRASAWRFGFDTPRNYNDNELFCGGAGVQWNQNGGKCGICGDPYQGPRRHEAGGPFATGTIVRTYPEAGTMEVTVELTANHLGWFEFRLCPHNDPSTPVSQDCLDRYLLPLVDGSGTRMRVEAGMRMITMYFQLPVGVTCSQCVLQWKYNTGNSWGTDPITGQGCLGCGPQEQFYGCSDVAIGDGENPPPVRSSTSRPRTTTRQRPTQPQATRPRPTQPEVSHPRSTVRPTQAPPLTNPPKPNGPCRAIGEFADRAGFHQWCIDNCSRGFCPSNMCQCHK